MVLRLLFRKFMVKKSPYAQLFVRIGGTADENVSVNCKFKCNTF